MPGSAGDESACFLWIRKDCGFSMYENTKEKGVLQ
jgi:hypothetical protein